MDICQSGFLKGGTIITVRSVEQHLDRLILIRYKHEDHKLIKRFDYQEFKRINAIQPYSKNDM